MSACARDMDCYEGRCLWCALIRIRAWVCFAYLRHKGVAVGEPAVAERDADAARAGYWSGA